MQAEKGKKKVFWFLVFFFRLVPHFSLILGAIVLSLGKVLAIIFTAGMNFEKNGTTIATTFSFPTKTSGSPKNTIATPKNLQRFNKNFFIPVLMYIGISRRMAIVKADSYYCLNVLA